MEVKAQARGSNPGWGGQSLVSQRSTTYPPFADKALNQQGALNILSLNTLSAQSLCNSFTFLLFESDQAETKLALFQQQADHDESDMNSNIRNLKVQLRDALERAEKAETEHIKVTESQVRLMSRANALEQKVSSDVYA